MPGTPGIPSPGPGSGKPAPPADGGTTTSKGGIKVKPRYEFAIVFVWKEPTPSDKLRPIKVPEKAAAPAAPPTGNAPPPSSPPPKSGGDEDGGLRIRGGGKDID
jgi:hypothetical protein